MSGALRERLPGLEEVSRPRANTRDELFRLLGRELRMPQRGYVSQFRWGIFRFQEGPMIQTLDCADVQAARWLSSGASHPIVGRKDATSSSRSGHASGVTREPNSRDERLR